MIHMKKLRIILVTIMFIIGMMSIVSCKSIEYVPVETVRIDTLKQVETVHDSVYVSDSTWQEVDKTGDTIKITKVKTQTKYKYINKTDTVVHIKYVEKPVVVEKQKELTAKEKAYIKLGKSIWWILSGIIATLGLFFIWKKKALIISLFKKLII